MKELKRIVSVFVLITLSTIGLMAQRQRQPYRVSNHLVSDILRRLEQSSDKFRNSLERSLVRSRIDRTRAEDDSNSFVTDFESATSQLNDRFNSRRAVTADVQNVLQRASLINDFMIRHRLNAEVQSDWAAVRSDLNALANAYRISWQWNRQTPVSSSQPYRLSDTQLDQLIRRIEVGGDTFRSSLTDAFDRNRYDQTRNEGNMNESVRSFTNATNQLRNRFDARQSVAGDVERLLGQATAIEKFMRDNRLTDRAQNDWSTLSGNLNALASAFNVSSNLQKGPSLRAWGNTSGVSNRLTGTFKLDPSDSDDPRDVADRATGSLSKNVRQGVYDRLLARLESPEMLAIERRGSTLAIASSRAPQSTFEADAREHQEQLPSGRSARLTATLRGDQLVVSSTGSRESDFSVTFEAIEDGRRLRVSRQIYSERLDQPVVIESSYDRTSDVAQWSVYNGSRTYPAGPNSTTSDDFILRDGESVTAVLNTDLTTKRAKQGDRFAMTVHQPTQYEGAVIEGTIASVDRGGRISGRSEMSLNFDTIRLRNGQTYKFTGIIENVRALNGETVQVDNEGAVKEDNSQTRRTIERGAIGTALGAIIGAIAGGGKGAVIGAVVGAAGGAGSVYVQGQDDVELLSGTEVTIRASAPSR